MSQNDRNFAVELLRGALAVAWLPFSWSADALRRSRGVIADPAVLVERAKFDPRNWTASLLKHLDWQRFEELCAAYYEALGFAIQVSRPRAGSSVDIAVGAAGGEHAGFLVHCKPWDAYRVGIKPLRELRAAMSSAGIGKG